jgi:hypothetical protein
MPAIERMRAPEQLRLGDESLCVSRIRSALSWHPSAWGISVARIGATLYVLFVEG